MTIEEVKAMENGRELDAAITRYVYGKKVKFIKGNPTGWKVEQHKNDEGEVVSETRTPCVWYPNDYVYDRPGILSTIPWPSNGWGAMQEVVAYMKVREYAVTIWQCLDSLKWNVDFCPIFRSNRSRTDPVKHCGHIKDQEDAPTAVCKAALITLILNNEVEDAKST